MAPATPEAKTNPHSAMRQYFPIALSEGEAFLQYISQILATDLHTFWPRCKSLCFPTLSKDPLTTLDSQSQPTNPWRQSTHLPILLCYDRNSSRQSIRDASKIPRNPFHGSSKCGLEYYWFNQTLVTEDQFVLSWCSWRHQRILAKILICYDSVGLK